MRPLDIKKLQFEPTSYCNARCPHCGRFDENGNLHPDLELTHLDIDTILDNLELLTLSSLANIIIEGDKGDPIMHPDIEKFIDRFYNLPTSPAITLMTNGAIRSAAWWSKLGAKYPRLRLTFSIDGLEDTNHLYRVGVNYAKAIANAQAYINAGGRATWKFLVFKHNEHQVAEAKEIAEHMGFANMILKSADRNRFNGLSEWPVRIDGLLSHYISPPSYEINEELILFKKSNFVPTVLETVNRICPNMSQGIVYINHQGYVVPCCMMHFDTENNYYGREQLEKLTDGLENQSLLTNTISQILDNKFFNNNLVDSLMGTEEQWHHNCARSCKSEIIENKGIL
jgi:MoaA/NifB/PqqE/SkfB family radical SAM enzyme